MMAPLGRLTNKRCLLVGGMGGLGQSAARRFLEEGAVVAIGDQLAEPGHPAFQSLSSLGPSSVHRADAAHPAEVDHLFAEAVESLGGLDVLYHLAGASGRRHGDGP